MSTDRRFPRSKAVLAALVLAVSGDGVPGANAAPAAGEITTYAGGLGEGTATSLGQTPVAVHVRPTGAGDLVYVLDENSGPFDKARPVVRVLDTKTGLETTLAASVGLNNPTAIAVDESGNVFVSETGIHQVKKITAAGVVTTVAGTGEAGDDGACSHQQGCSATGSRLNSPQGLALGTGGELFIADTGNHRIRKVSVAGVITTVAGTGSPGSLGDCTPTVAACPATAAQLRSPRAVELDSSEPPNLYIADTGNCRVRRVDGSTNEISKFAGSDSTPVTPTCGFAGDGGLAAVATLDSPSDLSVDIAGNVFVVDRRNHRIRRIDSATTVITTFAGSGVGPQHTANRGGFTGDGGPASLALLKEPTGVAISAAGVLFVADTGNLRIRKVDPQPPYDIATVAGNGTSCHGGDGGPATSAQLCGPADVIADGAGGVLVADKHVSRIRKIEPDGTVSTLAGTGIAGFGGDGGPASSAQLRGPSGIHLAPDGSVLVADTDDSRIRRIDASGVITTVAGTGEFGYGGDGGGATAARLRSPNAVATDQSGRIFVADTANSRIRMIDTTGVITTVAGSGEFAFGGDGGAAVSAHLDGPSDVTLDLSGNMLIADTGNHRIRKVGPDGTIITMVGNGEPGYSGDGGPAGQARLNRPTSVTVDPSGSVLIADEGNNRVRKITPDGEITTIAGSGERGSSGDGGQATSAELDGPTAVGLDPAGNLFVADRRNSRVRLVRDGGSAQPTPTIRLVNPSSLAQGASEDIVISGAEFAAGAISSFSGTGIAVTATTFDGAGSLRVSVEIAADAPPGSRDVVVTNAGGRSGRCNACFSVVAGKPRVISITPSGGPSGGGTRVTIGGINLGGGSPIVRFGEDVASIENIDETAATVISPAHPRGTVDVTVTTTGGTSEPSSAARFHYESGGWTQEDPLEVQRSLHTSTVLTGPACTGAPVPAFCGKMLVVGGHSPTAELYDPASDSSVFTENMSVARSGHTATLLRDARVLVVGGLDQAGVSISSAEIFNPSNGQWTAAGRLGEARSEHAAALLTDGTVLVAGGKTAVDFPNSDINRDLSSAEIFDPAAPRGVVPWTFTASMSESRSGVTGTTLDGPACRGSAPPGSCGTVLVVGGAGSSEAERYDTASRTWSKTGAMVGAPRSGHTATLLDSAECQGASAPPHCGQVLVVGGTSSSGDTTSAAVFDPGADNDRAWTAAGAAGVARFGHTATGLPSGRVIVAGGCTARSCSTPERLSSSMIYNPALRLWTEAKPLIRARGAHSAVSLPDGKVLVAGGEDGSRFATETAEIFDEALEVAPPVVTQVTPVSGTTHGGTPVTIVGRNLLTATTAFFGTTEVAFMPESDDRGTAVSPPHPRATVNVVVSDKNGRSLNTPSATFTYVADSWKETGSLSECDGCSGRYLHTATLLSDGQVLVSGGTTKFFFGPGLRSAQLYNPASGRWKSTGSLDAARFGHTATLLDGPACRGEGTNTPDYCGDVLVAGGQDGSGALSSAEVYDAASGSWTPAGSLLIPRFSHTATRLPDGRVLFVGGAAREDSRSVSLASAEIYDPQTKLWVAATPLAQARVNHSATSLPNGSILVSGGLTASPAAGAAPITSAEIYDHQRGTWSQTAPLAVARYDHTSTLLSGPECSASPPPAHCGKVLVAGGGQSRGAVGSSELFDPIANQGQGLWEAGGILRDGRAGHSATLLANGKVLVAGGGPTFPGAEEPGPLAVAEVYDPSTNGWTYTREMNTGRGAHAAILLGGPACKEGAAAPWCGAVLASGGGGVITQESNPSPVALASSELYFPGIEVGGLTPQRGRISGGTPVIISGRGFTPDAAVRFGDTVAPNAEVSGSQIKVMSPPHIKGPVSVSVENSDGTTAGTAPTSTTMFAYVGPPGEVTGFTADPISDSQIELRFKSADDGSTLAPAFRYLIKQHSGGALTPSPESGTALCGGECSFNPPAQAVKLVVGTLAAGTTYHYSVRALNEFDQLGPSITGSATTPSAPGTTARRCEPLSAPGQLEVAYPPGYSIVGLPTGSRVVSGSPLYGWLDQGAGGAYSIDTSDHPVVGGRGYWSWSACPRVATLGAGTSAVSLPLDGYHASMVGNPSPRPTTVSGHDFTARWIATLNGGSGGYEISGYRVPQPLGVGEGIWTFSFERTEIRIE